MADFTYTAPLSRGFNRMKDLLFRPFDLGTWLTVGFASFLSQIVGKLGESAVSYESDVNDPRDIFPWLGSSFDNLGESLALSGGFLVLLSAALLGALLLALLLAWVEARGRFVFLDNVVHKRGAISKPWSEYGREGNSLFIWKLIIDIVLFISIGLSVVLIGVLVFPGFLDKSLMPLSAAGMFISLWIILLVALLVAYLRLFIQDFVVVIMYKHRVSFTEAWSRFMGLLRQRPAELLLYGLFVAVLYVALSLVLGILGMATCCVGFLIVAIPYVGSVVLLPIHATYRAFSAEFLAQFGPEYDVFEGPVPEQPPVQPEPGVNE